MQLNYADLLKPCQHPKSVKSIQVIGPGDLKWGIWDPLPFMEDFINLEEMVINATKADFLFFDFSKLKKLRHIDLRNNDFGYWWYENRPALKLGMNFIEIDSLEYLNIEGNQLVYIVIPDGKYPNLKHLNAAWNKSEDRVPEQEITVSLGTLPKLEYLNLEWNEMIDFPDITHLISLKELHLGANKFTKIPSAINRLPQLQLLNLNNNQLSEFPDLSELKCLKTLDLSNNQIWWIEAAVDELECLENLDLSCNCLEEIPSEFFKFQRLRSLALAHNQLTSISSKIVKLKTLQALDLSDNQLNTLPEKLFQLSDLKTVNLRGNPIPTVLIEAWKTAYPHIEII